MVTVIYETPATVVDVAEFGYVMKEILYAPDCKWSLSPTLTIPIKYGESRLYDSVGPVDPVRPVAPVRPVEPTAPV